jgi:hypothetical protein
LTALSRPVGEASSQVHHWAPEASQSGDLAAERARALAHAALVQTSLKVAGVRAAVQSRLLDARTEAEEMLEAARDDAAQIRRQAREDAEAIHERALIEARHNTIRITDRALDRRDLLVIGTVEKIANLSTSLLGIADQLIANSIDRSLAAHHLAHFMLEVTEMVPEFTDITLSGRNVDDRDEHVDGTDSERMAA